jgi:hypothetical protein
MSSFTKEELVKIKRNNNKNFYKGIIVIIVLTPILCLTGPYIPSRGGGESLVDIMSYEMGVLIYASLWTVLTSSILLLNRYKARKVKKNHNNFFRKRIVNAKVYSQKLKVLKSSGYIAKTNEIGELEDITIPKSFAKEVKIGDEVILEVEEKTNTVLKINKR